MFDQKESKVRLDLFDSKLGFSRGATKLKEGLWYLMKVLFFLTAVPYPNSFKRRILIMFGAKVGIGLVIKPRVNIHMPWKLSIGDFVWIGEEAFLLNFEQLTIGNHVCISQRVFLCGGNHDYRTPSMMYRNGPITLLDGCWVGANSFISPGIVIGKDTIVTAGSVITKSLEENSIYKNNSEFLIKSRW